MTEILWHGRGGQGAFTAAKLLGAAYSLEENSHFALAFPSFGPERRGAPILAFTKLDQRQIGDRSQIKKADYTIFLDDTLFSATAFYEIKESGKILVSTKKTTSELFDSFSKEFYAHIKDGFEGMNGKDFSSGKSTEEFINSNFAKKIIPFDADSLAMEILKMPVTNTVMLSLLAAESDLVSLEALKSAISLYMAPKLYEKNSLIVDAVFEKRRKGASKND